jgi:hypothetical protein
MLSLGELVLVRATVSLEQCVVKQMLREKKATVSLEQCVVKQRFKAKKT